MSFDRKDYDDSKKSRLAERRAGKTIELKAIERAAVSAEAVTQTPEWDMFLSYIEADIKRLDGLISQSNYVLHVENDLPG